MDTPHVSLAHVECHDLIVSFTLVETRREHIDFAIGDSHRRGEVRVAPSPGGDFSSVVVGRVPEVRRPCSRTSPPDLPTRHRR